MRVLSWNCQGLGNYLTISYLRKLWKRHRPDFLFLSETKQDSSFLQKFQFHFGYNNYVTVDPCGTSGGLALFYNNIHNVMVLFKSNKIIDIEATIQGKKTYLSFIYGDPVPKLRDLVWERLTRSGLVRNGPWFMIGDFNEITGNNEKQGGKQRHASTFIQFNLMIRNCGMMEFPCLGDKMSWRGRRSSGVVRCRLDRALANEDWHDLFSHSFVEYLEMVGSDHRPVLATIEDKRGKKGKQFRFDKRWIGKEGLKESIESGWNENFGCHSFMEKISNCRRSISVWRKLKLSDGQQQKIEELQLQLRNVQNDDSSSQEKLLEINHKLISAYKEEEIFWKQKSRNTWLREGDNNTRFFHAQTKQRRARNRIIGLHNTNGVWKTEDKDILVIAQSYFKELFSYSSLDNVTTFLKEIPKLVTEDMNKELTAKATEGEIRKVLFMMHPEKSPGPDGMTALFFQKHWHIVKKDVIELVNNFLTTGCFDKNLNMTNICLIPKVDKPSKMEEFRPISLCNVSYKIISKVLCQRLKRVLPVLISETQSAFVGGRLISDNILLAQEMFHALRTNKACQSKYMAIKTDMSKAYDRLEWEFIKQLFLKLGFNNTWVSWIMWCISSVNYKVLLNGKPQGEIIPQRGLRQGDPLSPYIFILCTEALIANLKKAEREKQITGLKIARGSPPVSHLLFADDSLFFCKANKDQCHNLMKIIENYCHASGQKINLTKSSIVFGKKVQPIVKEDLKRLCGITKMGGIGTYLGLPESLGGAKSKIFSYVQERLNDKINGWSAKFLSKGGKEILIKSVANALPTYVMTCFRLPKTTTKKLAGAIAKFWWSSGDQRRGMHWLSWSKLCKRKINGGLGFRTLEDFNTALLAKQLWRLMDFPESLFARVFKGRYYKDSTPMTTNRVYSPSYGWKSIISARSLVHKGLIMRIGSGKTTSVWEDPWIPDFTPRPARCRGNNNERKLTVDKLINQSTKMWDLNILTTLMEPEEVSLICSLPISQINTEDKPVWHFTKSGRYTVKSGYQVVEEDINKTMGIHYGPNIIPLQANAWKLRCPRKIQHFVWQTLSGALAVSSNLNARGINCDLSCSRCGADRETINHALFECPPSLQVWALSDIPSPIEVFPSSSLFNNMDYLYKRIVIDEARSWTFPWILWYIWKARNDKLFNNIDRDPQDILTLVMAETQTWESAQANTDEGNMVSDQVSPTIIPHAIADFKCYIDGSWKISVPFAGQGWYCTSNRDDEEACFMGARNVRQSLSPLHAEAEALLWAASCMLSHGRKSVMFFTDCSELVKMMTSPKDWPAFTIYLEEMERLKISFDFFDLCFVSRNCNVKADALAKSVRAYPFEMSYVNFVPPVWLIEPF